MENLIVNNRGRDLLVGLVSPSSCSVSLEVGGRHICRLELHRDEPSLVLGGNNFLPILPSHMICLKSTKPVTLDIIYAYLGEPNGLLDEWSLEFGTDSWLHVSSGHVRVDNGGPRFEAVRCLPDRPWTREMERQKDRTSVFEEELVAVTWHPSRFQAWCLDMTEICSEACLP